MTTYTTDNRWSPGASGATVPDEALAVYSARWIDQGDDYPADIVPDRQGFAYNEAAHRNRLIELLQDNPSIRYPQTRDTTIYVDGIPGLRVAQRRAGGYVYVDAWIERWTDGNLA